MKPWGKLVLVALLLPGLGGCIRVATLIELNKDGSGHLLIRYLVSQDLEDDAALNRPLDEQQLLKKLGKGVRYVETTEVSKKGWRGYQVKFAFDDINELTVPFDGDEVFDSKKEKPDSDVAIMSMDQRGPFRFKYKPGDTNQLIVYHVPRQAEEKQPDPFEEAGLSLPSAPKTAPAGLAAAFQGPLMKVVLQGIRFTSLIKVEGQITETNAVAQPTDKSVTLIDLDLSKFTKSKNFEQAVAERWDVEKLLKERTPGVSALPMDQEIHVQFK